MGGLLSRLWWGGVDADIVDQKSGLNARDVYRVKQTWALVYKDKLETGTELLKRYFSKHPEAKEKFPILKYLQESEYPTSSQFSAHVLSLMTALNMVIENLAQPEIVIVMLQKLGDSHKTRKITEKMFEDLKQVLLGLLIEVLKLNNEQIESWSKTVTFMYKHIVPRLE